MLRLTPTDIWHSSISTNSAQRKSSGADEEETLMRVRLTPILAVLLGAVLSLLVAPIAFGHIKIYPTESTFGAREKYTMRVPNERQSPAIKVEGEFPAGLDVYDFEFKPG